MGDERYSCGREIWAKGVLRGETAELRGVSVYLGDSRIGPGLDRVGRESWGNWIRGRSPDAHPAGPSCKDLMDALRAEPRGGDLLSKVLFASSFFSC